MSAFTIQGKSTAPAKTKRGSLLPGYHQGGAHGGGYGHGGAYGDCYETVKPATDDGRTYGADDHGRALDGAYDYSGTHGSRYDLCRDHDGPRGVSYDLCGAQDRRGTYSGA